MFLHVGMEIVKLVFLGRFQNIEAKLFVLRFKIYLKITENFLLVGDRRRLKGATDADQNPFLQKCASHRLYNVYKYMHNCTLHNCTTVQSSASSALKSSLISAWPAT